MTGWDIAIAAAAIIGFVLGFKDGIIRKLVGFVGFIIAIFVAAKFADDFGKTIDKMFDIEFYLAEIIAAIVIFTTIILLAAIIKRLIHPSDKVTGLVNQLLGGAAGLIQILFFMSAVMFILNIFDTPSKETKNKSLLYNPVYNIVPSTFKMLNNYQFDVTGKLKEKIDDK